MEAKILVCDDDELVRCGVRAALEAAGWAVEEAVDGEDALAKMTTTTFGALVIDLSMPRLDGLEVLRRLRQRGPLCPTIVMTGSSGLEPAIEATRLGAAEYMLKPIDPARLVTRLRQLLRHTVTSARVAWVNERDTSGYERMIGSSLPMKRLFETLRRLESVETPTVLLTGESGTGKNLVAQAIHARGPRRLRPYLEIDCAAMPDTLIESELFGHEKGSFTDARATKRGLFEVAAGGVIFLDEIGEMSLATQAKLLRALENRRFKRVGGVNDIALDAAVIAATNRDLRGEVKAGRFREDLFFRLHVVPISVPPLRRRPEDIEAITLALVDLAARVLGRRVPGVTSELLQRLTAHSWPGNARELRNTIDRMMILKPDDGVLTVDDLPADALLGRPQSHSYGFQLPDDGVDLSVVESSFIEQALRRTQGNQTQAAKLLGISRFTLRHRGKRHGIDAPSRRRVVLEGPPPL